MHFRKTFKLDSILFLRTLGNKETHCTEKHFMDYFHINKTLASIMMLRLQHENYVISDHGGYKIVHRKVNSPKKRPAKLQVQVKLEKKRERHDTPKILPALQGDIFASPVVQFKRIRPKM